MLQRPPEQFDHTIVAPCAFAIHVDLDLRAGQHVDPHATGKLAALTGVDYFRFTVFSEGFL